MDRKEETTRNEGIGRLKAMSMLRRSIGAGLPALFLCLAATPTLACTNSDSPVYAMTTYDLTPYVQSRAEDRPFEWLEQQSRSEDGYIDLTAHKTMGRTSRVTTLEEWQCQDAYDQHMNGANMQKFLGLVTPLLIAPPEVHVHHLWGG